MDFDHVRGTKEYQIGRAGPTYFTEETLRAEIAKCDVVCANCHRERNYQAGMYQRKPFVPREDDESLYESHILLRLPGL